MKTRILFAALLVVATLATGCVRWKAEFDPDKNIVRIEGWRIGDQQIDVSGSYNPETNEAKVELKQVSQATALNTLAEAVKDLSAKVSP